MKVAIVHYWWLSNRGGEAVVTALSQAFPEADLFVHVCDETLVRKTLGPAFKGKITTSLISKLPFAKKHYQKYLPLMPIALEQWDLSEYDVVISSESGPAKGVITRTDAVHICYCHSPMRYLWDMYHQYLEHAGKLVKMLFPLVAHWMRVWDRVSADRVDMFIANSRFIAGRIDKYYRRQSEVIYPPVDVDNFSSDKQRGDFYLYLGQLVPYKRADLAVGAFNQLKLPLVVIGEGEMMESLRSMAQSNVTFLGRQSFDVVKDHLERCKGLIFPGVEDFGIVPVEALAAGAPVIAYGRGGVLDTVEDGRTGILFKEQSEQSLMKAVLQIESGQSVFNPTELRMSANKFDKRLFINAMKNLVLSAFHGAADESGVRKAT
jgi:glycosyltransferase involved in cell wall biosynthesis